MFVFLRRTAALSCSYRRQVCGAGLNYLRSRVGRALISQADAPFPSTPFFSSTLLAQLILNQPLAVGVGARRQPPVTPPRLVVCSGLDGNSPLSLLCYVTPPGFPPFFPSRSAVVRSRAVVFGWLRLTRKRGRLNRLSSGVHSIQTMFTHEYDYYYDYYVYILLSMSEMLICLHLTFSRKQEHKPCWL